MNTIQFRSGKSLSISQRGATLIIALMFLVILSILGIGMYQLSSSDEIVARNFRDKEIALRAAEAAVNEAKLRINGMFDKDHLPTVAPATLTGETCFLATLPSGFSCDRSSYTSSSVDLFGTGASYAEVGSYDPSPSFHVSPAIVGVSTQPRYLIVLTGMADCTTSGISETDTRNCYKIFAQARGRLSTTRANLIEMYIN